MKKTATLTSVITSSSAEWTGLRASTTPNAPTSASAAKMKKITAVMRQ